MLKLYRICAFLMLIAAGYFANAQEAGANLSPVVKVFAVYSRPNFHQPWQNYPQSQGIGSGCVIDGNRILTNAHVTANQTFLMVRRQGDPRKYVARVLAYGHECDLALLTVDDPAFFADIAPLEIGELPDLQDTVLVMGYPMGGDNISITKGVVSRIEPATYSHSGRQLLAIQIDAAINPGNSGGPVVKDDKLIGVAFQGNRSGENMGYMVPVPMIRHFFDDIEDGNFDGFPDIDISISKMENPDLRRWAKMSDEQSGVLVSHVPPPEERKGVFKEGDVLLEVDGANIANDASIPFRNKEVIFFGHLIWQKQVGEICRFKILRNGKELELDYRLENPRRLVSHRSFGKLPSYYIIGGLLFMPLTQNYLDAWGGKWWQNAPRHLVYFVDKGKITKERDEVVVLSAVLADDVNIGYQHISFMSVEKINGTTVRNLKHMIELIESLDGDFLELSLEQDLKLVLDLNKARSAMESICGRYRIPADRSADLL